MKLNIVIVLVGLILISGCTSKVFYNIPENTKYTEKSILFLETKGHPLSGTQSLSLISVNGQKTEDKISTSKIEFKPGVYNLQFKVTGKAGLATSVALGMTGGQAAMNTHMYGTNRNTDANDTNEFTFQPGSYYFASFKINEQNQAVITIEEI